MNFRRNAAFTYMKLPHFNNLAAYQQYWTLTWHPIQIFKNQKNSTSLKMITVRTYITWIMDLNVKFTKSKWFFSIPTRNQKLGTKFSRVSSSFVKIFYERCDVLIPLQVLTTLNAPRFYNDVLYMDGTLDVEGIM